MHAVGAKDAATPLPRPCYGRRVKYETGGGHDASLEYHARMLADPHRVVAYDRALRRLVRPGDRVLDAGAGTGLLAMLAARAGASHVWAVESMPIAEAMRALVERNGLSEDVTTVNIDLREFEGGPFDVIVSDCLGRFLIDDHMMEAMTAACRLLAPGGHVIPGSVELLVAPVALVHLATLDTWVHPILGLDLTPLAAAAEHEAFGVHLGPDAVLAEPQTFATWRPPAPAPVFEQTLTFTLTRPGRLRGVAGWFRAELAPGVVLSTEPGVETHWHQLLFPLPPMNVVEGDRLEVHLRLGDRATTREPPWFWDARLVSASGAAPTEVARHEDDPLAHIDTVNIARTSASETRDPADLNARGASAFAERDYPAAITAFEAAVSCLRPDDDATWAADVYENLGLARATAGFHMAAMIPLMRALGDGLTTGTPREQSLRVLVDVAFRSGRVRDGERFLARYVEAFGHHPSGWARTPLPS